MSKSEFESLYDNKVTYNIATFINCIKQMADSRGKWITFKAYYERDNKHINQYRESTWDENYKDINKKIKYYEDEIDRYKEAVAICIKRINILTIK